MSKLKIRDKNGAFKEVTGSGYDDTEIKQEISSKQDKLTAGNNITIENNVISATGGGTGGVSQTYVDEQDTATLNSAKAYADEQVPTKVEEYVTAHKEELKGDKGDKGDTGETGAQGEQGPQGIQGEKGEKGDTGPQGEQGIQGIQGEKGADGKDGTNGTDGKDGVDGQDGKDGADGKNYSVEVVETTDSTITIEPNKFYKFAEITDLNISLAEITDTTQLNEYMFEFTSGETATTLTLPDTIKWLETPTIEVNKIYQCSIVDNVGVLLGVDV